MSDVIDGAIALLEEHGWCRYELRDEQGRRCVLGALIDAGNGRDDEFMRAYEALTRVIGSSQPSKWNNNEATGVDQVIAKLREAKGLLAVPS